MAKSKSGGTRSLIRGRVGSDVYSIGKDGKGQRQQVVRSLAETVANPRTVAQMANRMYMSTVMQAVAALSPIIDHSFDGMAKGQPSISEFIRQNYALVKADAIAHPASDNEFGLNKYQEKGIKVGKWLISSGSISKPAAVTFNTGVIIISLTNDTLTVGGLKAALGLSADGYLTSVTVSKSKGAQFFRAKLTTTLADSTAITGANVESLFTIEGNVAATPALDDTDIRIACAAISGDECHGGIVSELVDGAWKHSRCQLYGMEGYDFASDVALPTYPTGNEVYLNGGDL